MAKVINKFEFATRGGGSEYDWDTLLDGKIRECESGKDFSCKANTFVTLARNAAKKRGMIVKSGRKGEGEDANVVIQAVEASDEQKAKWAEAAERAKEEGSEEETATE